MWHVCSFYIKFDFFSKMFSEICNETKEKIHTALSGCSEYISILNEMNHLLVCLLGFLLL